MGSPRPGKRKKGSSGRLTSKTILELYPREKLSVALRVKVTPSMAKFLRRRNASRWVREAILMRLRKEKPLEKRPNI